MGNTDNDILILANAKTAITGFIGFELRYQADVEEQVLPSRLVLSEEPEELHYTEKSVLMWVVETQNL